MSHWGYARTLRARLPIILIRWAGTPSHFAGRERGTRKRLLLRTCRFDLWH